jgi:hypothetical protein
MTTQIQSLEKKAKKVPAYFLAAYECAVLRDSPAGDGGTATSYDPQMALHTYFTDLYQVFLTKVASIPVEPSFTVHQEQRMQDMLAELLKVKRMLNGSEEDPL